MSRKISPEPGINSWIVDEIYQQYLHNRSLVDESWSDVFEARRQSSGGNGRPVVPAAGMAAGVSARPAYEAAPGETLIPLRGIAAKIAENMETSLGVPTATSQRTVPVKVIDENRRIINQHQSLRGESKISYTHLFCWAVLQALKEYPGINAAYAVSADGPVRVERRFVNLGVAVDVAGKDGARSLLVPNIKNAEKMNFREFLNAFDDIVQRARTGKLAIADFQGTTISLTNPGTVGTVSSIPRLMEGQGAILATGIVDYPPGFQGVAEETRAMIGISKIITLTCTYDHRVIQGAESGLFLARVHALLQGEFGFYDEIFHDLHVPYRPVAWQADRPAFSAGAGEGRRGEIAKEAAVLQLINAYRVRGHLIADLNPLGVEPKHHPELDPANYGLTIWDLDREFLTGTLGDDLGEGGVKGVATLREILETLRQTYSGKIGCEYMHIQHPEQKRWLQERMEPQANHWPLARETRLRVLEKLIEAEEFERFLHTRFIGQKRFSVEGGEAAIAVLDALLDRCAESGAREAVIGMAHRGRLNVLVNTAGKPPEQIFSEFEGEPDPSSTQGSGDVKYHLGSTTVHRTPSGKELVVSVAPNPSHLEAVDPVVEGLVRTRQNRLLDTSRERVIPILIHGDAAFAGQGVVAETLNLSQLEGYHTGGTIHLVINNQIGFTTLPYEGRSSAYCTDVARMVQAPVFHVNGDDPEAGVRAMEIAYDYRQRFHKDVVVDLICYRRHGHNEGDDPSYTQPLMYRKIRELASVAEQYSDRLVREKLLTREEIQAIRSRVVARYEAAFRRSKEKAQRFEIPDLGSLYLDEIGAISPETWVPREKLNQILDGLTTFPPNFNLHPKLKGLVQKRREAMHTGGPIDWALAELLAFGSLVLEGTKVRLSGQDSSRGTFSQRHSVFVDVETGKEYTPLKHLSPDQAKFTVYDSSLSEYAVLGFEFGYSVGDPLALVIWEAQFGDFANGAQIMVDQFITTSEQKWGQPCGLVMLLPHGYEGQGPEHSSARIERFLILCAEGNMYVCNCTTPAQYFHLLRRQMHGGPDRRGLRKPLVVFTPKSLLRSPKAVSHLDELASGRFLEVLDDRGVANPAAVKRVLLCSGKVYYDLLAGREARQASDVAIVRVEQLYPYPEELLVDALARYPDQAEVVWVQEEPQNMGPWRFMQEWTDPLLETTRRRLRYAGRRRSASPATGSAKRHAAEQAKLVEDAFADLDKIPTRRPRVVSRRRMPVSG